ncbi:MAG TPA: ABC transporter permease [Candidatus Polarisedimenticolaceae bacterium]|nr:ABC transporter permease [Candidatus Polarisedimenticolaceae bacterium]
MNARTLVRASVRSILKNRTRALLTVSGVVIGVAAVIVMVAVGQGARDEIKNRVTRLGTNLIVVTPGAAQQGAVSQGAQTFTRLTVADADAVRRQRLLVTAVTPVIVTRGQLVGGEGNWRSPIYGVHEDYFSIRDWSADSGSLFAPDQVRASRKVALLGKTVAEALFPGADPVGQKLRMRDVPFDIIGVLQRKGQTAEGADQDDVVIIPYTTAQTRLAGHSFLPQILASAASPAEVPGAQEEIREVIRGTHQLTPGEPDDFTIRNQADLIETASATTQVMTVLLLAIASISLLVGGIGIMNIMLVSVTERTREIGLRLAVGARGTDVLTQFLVESVVLCLVGGALGIGLGFVSAAILQSATGWQTAVSVPAVVLALGFSVAVGVFFGLYPARKAAALDPIEALRHE